MKTQKEFFILMLVVIFNYCSQAQVTAAFIYSYDTADCSAQTVDFIDQSTGNISSWYWDFGDTTSSSLQNPKHTYSGFFIFSYQVTLIVTDGLGSSDTIIQTVDQSGRHLDVTISVINPVSCIGPCDHSAVIIPYGTFPPYTLRWSSGATTIYNSTVFDTLTNLCAGGYDFTITDAPVCESIHYHFSIASPFDDCIWPGDGNSDGIANNQDVLAIGIAHGHTGSVRPNGSTNWIGQPCPDWVDTFSNGVNHKHADCNGEGEIDSNDVSVISLNYGLIHAKSGSTQRMIDPDLFLVFPQDSFQTGDTVTGTINLGTTTTPVNNIYGIAFSLTYNQNIIDSGSIRVDFTNSWVAPASRVSLAKDLFAASKVDIGHSRSDHNNTSGFGVLADVSFVIQDNIDGKDYFVLPLEIQFEDVVAIDKDEAVVNVTANGDTLYVEGETVGIETITQKYNVKIFPNPATNEINVIADVEIVEYSIMDIIGRVVVKEMPSLRGMASLTVNVSALETGSYFINLKSADHYSICRKVVVCR